MKRATIDPGSAVVAVLIYDDAAAPFVARYVVAKPFEVGEKTKHDPPLTGFYADKKRADGTIVPGGPWTRHETREVTREHEQEAAKKVVAYLLVSGAKEVTIERIGHAYGKTIQEVIGKSKFLQITDRIASSITARCMMLGIKVTPGPLAVTWRARLVPLVREHGGDVAGPAIKGKGAALDPVLAAMIDGWPAPGTWGEEHVDHVRVVGGMALWSLLPPLPGAKRKADGPRRPRTTGHGKRTPKGGKAARYPRGVRAWGKKSPEERERVQRVERERARRMREAKRGDRPACTCREQSAAERRTGGRHKRTCAAFVARPERLPPSLRTCAKCGRLFIVHVVRGVCPG